QSYDYLSTQSLRPGMDGNLADSDQSKSRDPSLSLTLSSFARPDLRLVHRFQPTDTFAAVLNAAQTALLTGNQAEIKAANNAASWSADTPARLWLSPPAGDCCGSGGFELVTDYSLTLRGRVRSGQCALIELRVVRGADASGHWPRADAATAAIEAGAVVDARSGLLEPPPLPAMSQTSCCCCGLSNPGADAGALNAALQLLCGVPRLVDQLLVLPPAGNGAGRRRPLTDAICELLRAMTSGLYEFVSARAVGRILMRQLRATMSACADPKEELSRVDSVAASLECVDYLACLLNGLHVELAAGHSASKKQPPREADGAAAAVTLVSDLFTGQLQCVTECCECGHQSDACQPFVQLSLNSPTDSLLPSANLRPFHFCLVPALPLATGRRYQPTRCRIDAPTAGQAGDLCALIGVKFGIRSDCLLLAQLTDGKVARVFSADDWYADYGLPHQEDSIYCYELVQPVQSCVRTRDHILAIVYMASAAYSAVGSLPAFPLAVSLSSLNGRLNSLKTELANLFEHCQFDFYQTDCRAVTFSNLSDCSGESSGGPAAIEYFAAVPRAATEDAEDLLVPPPPPPPRPEWFRVRSWSAQDFNWDASRCQFGPGRSRNRVRLSDCLSELWRPGSSLDRRQAWLCPSCGAFGQRATRRQQLRPPLPPVLLIRLADCRHHRAAVLDFPIRGFSPLISGEEGSAASASDCYDLLAVAWRYRCFQQQYVVYVRSRHGDAGACRWHRLEDGRVDCLSADSRVFDEAAFAVPCVLVYGRRPAAASVAGE
ncbi:hypothetical protein BOX15_Mlig027673g1, partial [Macrostomum lignano]